MSTPVVLLEISTRIVTPAPLAKSTTAGAVIEFHGVVRELEDGRKLLAINYECFEPMARAEFTRIFNEVTALYPLESISLHHRIGEVKSGEPSLWVRVTSGHRREAFAACQWIIERMKERVPIWKRPVYASPT